MRAAVLTLRVAQATYDDERFGDKTGRLDALNAAKTDFDAQFARRHELFEPFLRLTDG
ncbi:hypothetical protein WKW79_28940 [Variovorax robiniae]|uniref:Uncharacterized protein n=1 Tax=Variovorax robiniae TaxID=1836199 RepID=A0ABU8XFW7_9BURK